MNAFTIARPEEQAHRLRELAREAGISPEQLCARRRGVADPLRSGFSGFAGLDRVSS